MQLFSDTGGQRDKIDSNPVTPSNAVYQHALVMSRLYDGIVVIDRGHDRIMERLGGVANADRAEQPPFDAIGQLGLTAGSIPAAAALGASFPPTNRRRGE